MKTILLLGGFGFIGSNILSYIDKYLSHIYEVVVFDKCPEHYHGLKFGCVKKSYAGDFADESNISTIFQENKIDFVIHSLSSTVPITSGNAQYDVESNLIPTLKLLNIMEQYKVKDIIYLSSGGAIYGDQLQKVHSEEDAVYPKSSYGIVKLSIEKYLLSYAELYGFNSLILRLSNPFGYYHFNSKQGIINIAIRKALKGETLQIWGNGDGSKDYIYIYDVCAIIFKLVENGVHTNVLNIASGFAYSVNEIVEHINKFIPNLRYEYINASQTDVQSFKLDITKLRHILSKFVFTPFDVSIQKTIDWEKSRLID